MSKRNFRLRASGRFFVTDLPVASQRVRCLGTRQPFAALRKQREMTVALSLFRVHLGERERANKKGSSPARGNYISSIAPWRRDEESTFLMRYRQVFGERDSVERCAKSRLSVKAWILPVEALVNVPWINFFPASKLNSALARNLTGKLSVSGSR